ncbi:MAG: anaerobic ribonucleoside-triphosphate reductase [Candidatus Bathyarchaeia archaeon]
MVDVVKPLPMVRSSSGHFIPWNRQNIVNSLLKETKLATMFFGVRPMTEEEAESIALEVEAKIKSMDLKFISGPLIREIVNTVLLEKGSFNPLYRIYRNVYTRVGTPVYDAYEIDVGKGFEAKENANLQPNAETSHKKKADKTSKEEYLLLMPIELADAHLKGEIHIHDLEYFGTRPFCQDWDLRYFFYYGFMPDGMGIKTSVARAAQRAEVAVLHSVKVLAAAQTNFSGGEGFYNYLVFLAPYVRGLNYDNVKQLMQMMFYELTQIYVARGGQPVFSNIQITPGVPKLWEDVPIVARGRIGPDKYGDYEDEVRILYRALNEVALQGDYWGKPFNFPKLENGIVPELFNNEYDEEWLLAHKVVAKFGSPYFDNMIPEYRGYGKGVSCYQCLPGDELVVVRRNGSITALEVREVKTEDEILSCSMNSFNVEFSSPKSMLIKPYNGYMYTLQLEGGRRIRVTEDHPIPVLRNGKQITVPACEVRLGDGVFIVLKFPRNTVNEINVDESILSSKARYKLPGNIAVNRGFAELLGLYLAKGDAKKVPRGGIVRFSFGKHEGELAGYVKKLLEDIFHVKAHICEFKTAIVVQAGSIQLYRFLVEQLKVGRTSSEKDVPTIVFQFPNDAIWAFLKGVFKGDGGLFIGKNQRGYKTYSLQLRLSSKKACQKIVLLSGFVGLPLNYYEHRYGMNNKKIYVCRLTSRRAIECFMREEPVVKDSRITLKVKKIDREKFNGIVYDPVEIKGNHFVNALGVITHNCCAYNFVDTPDGDPEFEEKLYFVDGKHFSMGSWQVVTINLPRAAYKSKGEDDRLYEEVERLMDACVDVFKTKNQWMTLMIENNRIPFATQRPKDPVTGNRGPPPVNFEELVWTIGIVGVNEMVQYHTGYQLHESDEAVKVAVRLILEMKKYIKELEEKSGFKLALARTPAESCAQRLAVCDLIDPEFKDAARKVVKGDLEATERLLTMGERDVPIYYSNGTHVYVGARIPLLERMRIENKFFPILNGGNMFHIWLGEATSDPEALYKFTKRIAFQTQIGYFAYTKDLTICEDCNRVSGGLNSYCLECGSTRVRWWSRVTGYYQEVKGWNRAKRHEFFERYRVSIT